VVRDDSPQSPYDVGDELCGWPTSESCISSSFAATLFMHLYFLCAIIPTQFKKTG
jgi:hypothetical protein